MTLTRFVPSIAPTTEPVVGDPLAIENVRAVVQLRGHGELIVGTDGNGIICVTPDRGSLAARAKAQLAFHDVASSGRTIELDAQELYVFDLQSIEMLPDAPGINDALYAYGVMARVGADATPVEGQLTVTRADLLSGLVDGVANAFAYAPDASGSRAVHALLPGERADMIAIGRGIVLALPLAPAWMPDCPVPNDLVVAQLVYDVLSALRADMKIDAPLPVPDRAAVEAALVSQGWRIEGECAVRAKSGGLLGALRGSEKRALPRQGTLDELIAEARATLATMQGVPSDEAKAIAARRAKPVARPTASAPFIPAPTPRVVADKADWMKDFGDKPARSPAQKPATPAWMEDFADTEPDDDE